MTNDEIIAMAREAQLAYGSDTNVLMSVKHFAKLIAAKEREACAFICDELHWPWHMGDNSGPKECAKAIRARGEA